MHVVRRWPSQSLYTQILKKFPLKKKTIFYIGDMFLYGEASGGIVRFHRDVELLKNRNEFGVEADDLLRVLREDAVEELSRVA